MALDYLKGKKIVHRDIKPANMLLDSQGHVHVTDFNVASIVRPNVHITSTTGTKPYMGMCDFLKWTLALHGTGFFLSFITRKGPS